MVRIRLRRTGKKKQPSYRVVVADIESPRDGRFIENIGVYNPRTDPITITIQEERALYWLSQGAQPSDAVARILRKTGVMAKFEAIKSGVPIAEVEDAEATEKAAEDILEKAAEAEAAEEPVEMEGEEDAAPDTAEEATAPEPADAETDPETEAEDAA